VGGPGEMAARVEISPGQQRPLVGSRAAYLTMGQRYPYRWSVGEGVTRLAEGMLYESRQGLRLRVERFEPDFVFGADRRVTSRSQELNNPAVEIALYEGDERVYSQWLFAKEALKAMMHQHHEVYGLDLMGVSVEEENREFQIRVWQLETPGSEKQLSLGLEEDAVLEEAVKVESEIVQAAVQEWSVRLIETRAAYRTTLSVTRNPAVPLVYVGCTIVLLGLTLAFLARRRELWFRVDRDRGRLQVVARYRYGREDLDGGTERALAEMAGIETERKAED
ncbi:cytochrome c biogenesis protein ResB, partial [bacterium]|nr:cytochrome c biogenesis protein ResB [bacterium]